MSPDVPVQEEETEAMPSQLDPFAVHPKSAPVMQEYTPMPSATMSIAKPQADDEASDVVELSSADASPATILSAVVFPQPDGPTSTMNSPSSTSSEKSSSAVTLS